MGTFHYTKVVLYCGKRFLR